MSSFLDDRGRLFGKVNLVDILVVVALAALIAFAFLRFSDSVQDQTTIRTTFTIEKIRDLSVKQFRVGDQVGEETGTVLGTIKEVSSRPYIVEVPTAEGELKLQESPLYFDVVIVVEGVGSATPGLVRVGSVPMRVGKFLVISGPTFEARAQIRNVEVASS